ncbi:MAG: GldG family protein [Verrucomicrobiae bacterium]|nr:GldG family protein [Verrucomicrobiae bacterium]
MNKKPSRITIASSVVLTLIFAGVLVTAINYLSYRHYRTFDFSDSQYFTLSEKTINFLQHLEEPVTIYLFFNPENPLYSRVEPLLRRYQDEGGSKVIYELIDPYRDAVKAQTLSAKYRLGEQDNVVILDYQGRSKFVDASEMAEMETPSPFGDQTERVKSFKAEEAITSALVSLVQEKPSKIYFTAGHGEGDVTSSDPKIGFSELNLRVERENIVTTNLNLLLNPVLPDDADAIVIAGPTTAFQEDEVAVLRDYLKRNGKLLLLLEPGVKTGLELLLEEYGVIVDNDYVVGIVNVLGAQRLLGSVPVEDYGNHPIVEKMKSVTTVLNSVCSVRAKLDETDSEKNNVVELLKSPAAFWGETDFKQESVSFEEAKDYKGPLSLAVAVDTGKVGEEKVDLSGARLVVIGSTSSFSNQQLVSLPGVLDLFLNSMNWLLKKNNLIGISPKTAKEFSLGLTDSQLMSLALIIGFALPVSVLLIGFGVWWRRRR